MTYSIFDNAKLEEFRKEHKLQPFRIKQILTDIFKNSVIDFDEFTTLSKDLKELLKQNFHIISLKNTQILSGPDSTKMLFETHDGHNIESMLMYHTHDGGTHGQDTKLNRITICLSSQIGCAAGCAFCVTGKLGIKRNLTYQEILEQILFANNHIKKNLGKKEDGTWWKIRNVVFMGMGEPLLNYENLKETITILLSQQYFGLSKRHITISTCGVVPGIKKLIQDNIDVKLAISLHAPTQEVRSTIMPIATKYSLDELMRTIDEYVVHTDNRIFYEYIMIKDITDTPELATDLSKLLKNRLAHVNLIAYNENPAIDMQESNIKAMNNFKKILESNGITVTIRDSFGRDIKGACGQLGYEKLLKNSMI